MKFYIRAVGRSSRVPDILIGKGTGFQPECYPLDIIALLPEHERRRGAVYPAAHSYKNLRHTAPP